MRAEQAPEREVVVAGPAHPTAAMVKIETPQHGVPRVIVYLCAVIMFINYADRVNISVAVIGMQEEYGWSRITQGHILGSFFYGYCISQVLGSVLAYAFGAREVLAVAALGWSVLTLLTPSAAGAGVGAMVVCRICLGLFEGMCFPCVFAILSASRPERRSSNISLQIASTYFATVFTLAVSEEMLKTMPWQRIFQVFGVLGLLWLVVWRMIAFRADTQTRQQVRGEEQRKHSDESQLSTRELIHVAFALLRHRNTFAIFVGHFAHAYCHFLALSWLPTYFAELDPNKGEGGHRSHATQIVAPYVIMTICSLGGARAADWAFAQGYDKTYVRKASEVLGYGVGALSMLLFVAVKPGRVASALLAISIGSSGLTTSGHEAAKLDVAPPEFVGLLQGVSNTLAAFSGVIGVPIAAYINEAFDSWKAVFAMVGAVYGIAAITYAVYGTSQQIAYSSLTHRARQINV